MHQPASNGAFVQPVNLSSAREKIAKKTFIRLPEYPAAGLDKALEECKADKVSDSPGKTRHPATLLWAPRKNSVAERCVRVIRLT